LKKGLYQIRIDRTGTFKFKERRSSSLVEMKDELSQQKNTYTIEQRPCKIKSSYKPDMKESRLDRY
jgi:hypothetical protein